MNRPLASRLAMDLVALVLLLVALAYYWLDNPTHEVVGIAMFVLVLLHNALHRRWYKGLPRRQSTGGTVDKVLVLCLLGAMVTLLVTSVMISQTVFAAVAAPDAFSARRIHLMAAYWVLILVAMHVGIRWRVIYHLMQGALGIERVGIRKVLAHVSGAVLAAGGLYSAFRIGIGGKLLAEMSLDGWDFLTSTGAFFVHHVAFVGLLAYVSHHTFGWIRGASTR